MRFEQLEHLLAIEQTGSITNAGNLLYTSHQNISKSIRQLESELGFLLFIRDNNKLYITEKGKLVCKYAQELLENKEKILALSNEETAVKKEIYNILIPSLFYYLMASYTKKYTEQNKSIDFYIESKSPMYVLEKIACDDINLYAATIAMFEYEDYKIKKDKLKENFSINLLGTDNLFFLGTFLDSDMNERDTITIQELEEYELTFDVEYINQKNFYIECLKKQNYNDKKAIIGGSNLIHQFSKSNHQTVGSGLGTIYPEKDGKKKILIKPEIEIVYVLLIPHKYQYTAIKDFATFFLNSISNNKLFKANYILDKD